MGSDCLSDPQEFLNHVWLIFSSCEFFYCVFKILGIILSLLIWDQQTISSSISSLILGSLLYLGRGMETQDNAFLLVIDGVRKEKEGLTAAKKKKKKKKTPAFKPPLKKKKKKKKK